MDALVFTAGIGENSPGLRAAEKLEWLGVALVVVCACERHWIRGEYQQAYEDFQNRTWSKSGSVISISPTPCRFLGRIDEAKTKIAALLKMKPRFTIREADAYYRMWCFEPSFREKMRGALRLAGLPE